MSNKVTFKVAGASLQVEADVFCASTLALFESLSGKMTDGIDFYRGTDLLTEGDELEDGDTIVGVKSKFQSNARVTFKVAGTSLEIETKDDCFNAATLALFEQTSGKMVEGMDFYNGIDLLTEGDELEDGDTIVGVKSKFQSNR